MDSQQPLININNNNNFPSNNQYPNAQEINPSPAPIPYYPNNNNNYYPQNNNQNNPTPQEVLQYPNSADFPQYNQITNTNQPQVDYSKYTNINQLNHRGIKQTDNNTFKVAKRCCSCDR